MHGDETGKCAKFRRRTLTNGGGRYRCGHSRLRFATAEEPSRICDEILHSKRDAVASRRSEGVPSCEICRLTGRHVHTLYFKSEYSDSILLSWKRRYESVLQQSFLHGHQQRLFLSHLCSSRARDKIAPKDIAFDRFPSPTINYPAE